MATLAFGLREDSRTKMKIAGQKISKETLLLAAITDRLSWLVYANTEDAKHNRNKPKSIVEAMLAEDKTADKVKAFRSGADFDAAFLKITGGE